MEDQSLSQKIIRNTIFNIIGRFWGILILLLLTPYIISRIGIERYGLWAIIGAITGYFGLLDFGIGTSFVKYIAEFYTKKEYEKINQVVNTGFAFYSIFTILVISASLFLINPLLVFLKIPQHLYNEALFVLLMGIALFGLSKALAPFAAILTGLQRMDISNKVAIAISLPNIAGTIFFLEKGYGLVGLMINNIIIFAISSIVNMFIAFKILPELNFNPLTFSKKMFKTLFRFGYKLQISHFANLVSFQTDKLLITYFLGIGLVAFYQLGSFVLQQVRQIPLLLISALVPAVSVMEARNQKESLKELYLIGSKYLIFISVPLTLFVIANASLIMLVWMGKEYKMAALVIQVLAAGYLAATVSGVASSIAVGLAKTEFEMKFGIFMAILNLFLSIILIIKIGFIGAAIGTTISLTIASIIFMKIFHRYLGCPLKDFIQLFYKPITACIVPTSVILIFNHSFLSASVLSNRIFSLIILGVNSVIFGIMYIVFILLNRYFNEYDKTLFKTKVPFLKYLLID